MKPDEGAGKKLPRLESSGPITGPFVAGDFLYVTTKALAVFKLAATPSLS